MIVDFDVAYDGHVLKGDQYVGADSNRLLYLHGAGASTRRGHHVLRGALQQRGIGSTCFDCIGHGDTGGALAQSSVASRTRQAQAVIAARGVPEPLAVVGASMGAYNAIRMTQSHRVDALVLIVPGVYTPSAYEVPFGPEFSALIRRERSWADSDATIPLEIPERLVAAATRAQSSRLHIVQGAEHNRLWSLLEEDPASFGASVDMVAETLK